MKIGLIGAMEEEIRLLKQALQHESEQVVAGYTFYQGQLSGQDVVLVQSGIGKVNAAMTVTLLKQLFDVNLVINTGSAGALGHGLKVGDVVVADQLRHHDADVTAFGYQIGQMAGMPAAYETHSALSDLAAQLYQAKGKQVYRGLIVSGDAFVAGPSQQAPIKANFPEALACEMESAAIAQAAYVLKTPCVVIRAISDSADDQANISFDEFILLAGKESASLVMELLERMGEFS